MIARLVVKLMQLYFKVFPKQWENFAIGFKEQSLCRILQLRKDIEGMHEKQALYLYYKQIRRSDPVKEHEQIRICTLAAYSFFHETMCQD